MYHPTMHDCIIGSAVVYTYHRGLQCCLFRIEGHARTSDGGTAIVQSRFFVLYPSKTYEAVRVGISQTNMKTEFLNELAMQMLEKLGLSLNYQTVTAGLDLSDSTHQNYCDGCGNSCSSDCYGGCEGSCQGGCNDSCRNQSW